MERMFELNQAIIMLVVSNRLELKKKDIVCEETEPQIKRKSNSE